MHWSLWFCDVHSSVLKASKFLRTLHRFQSGILAAVAQLVHTLHSIARAPLNYTHSCGASRFGSISDKLFGEISQGFLVVCPDV